MTRESPADAGGDGTLASGIIWGIKGTFLKYLSGMPDAKFFMGRGALEAPGGAYFWPLSSSSDYDEPSGTRVLKFGGDVRFSGHHRMLYVMFVEPWIVFDDDGAHLSIADPDAYPDLGARLPLVDLDLDTWQHHSGARFWSGAPTRLRPEALGIFNNVYQSGELFDPIHIRVGLGPVETDL